ncbi:MAG: hypothetical protein M3321_12875 [Actinomycetota bacterium]|nr:hypothetical protein [Actinomycetota bacterium]
MQATTPELRPLSVGEVLDVAIKIFFRHAAILFAIVLPIVLPVEIVSSLIELSTAGDEDPFTEPTATGELRFDTDELWLFATGFVVVLALALVASTLATGACFKAVGDAYLGERPSARGSLAFALRRVHSIVWVTFLSGLVALLGFIACVLPGIWLYVSFAVAVPALLMEDVRGRRALGRSWRLVKGRWWPTFGIVVLGALLTGVVTFAIVGLLEAVALADPDNDVVSVVSSALGGTLASALTTPFQAAFVSVLYFDLRVRKEGFDLELLAERIGLTHRPEGAFRPAPELLPPAPMTGERPPYWPPPPGWTPSGSAPESPSLPADEPGSDQPPYWPPPPGWKPGSER